MPPTITAELAPLLEHMLRESNAESGNHAAVATFLLGSPAQVELPAFRRHTTGTSIDWAAVTAEPIWSAGHRILMRTAASLFLDSGYEVSVGSLAVTMDSDTFHLWLAMIEARRTGKIPPRYLPQDSTTKEHA